MLNQYDLHETYIVSLSRIALTLLKTRLVLKIKNLPLNLPFYIMHDYLLRLIFVYSELPLSISPLCSYFNSQLSVYMYMLPSVPV